MACFYSFYSCGYSCKKSIAMSAEKMWKKQVWKSFWKQKQSSNFLLVSHCHVLTFNIVMGWLASNADYQTGPKKRGANIIIKFTIVKMWGFLSIPTEFGRFFCFLFRLKKKCHLYLSHDYDPYWDTTLTYLTENLRKKWTKDVGNVIFEIGPTKVLVVGEVCLGKIISRATTNGSIPPNN
jgi:hypothetical protein